MFSKPSMQTATQSRSAINAARMVDLSAPENAVFVGEFAKARTAGLLLSWDVSEYVLRRRQDAGLTRCGRKANEG